MRKFGVKTIFANDRPLTLAGMEYVARNTNAIDLIAICRTPQNLIESMSRMHCDVVVIDFAMRGNGQIEGLALLGYLRRTYPKVGIVALVTHENPVILRSILDRDVASVVSKFDDVGHIVTAIHSCFGSGSYLSPLIKRSLELVECSSNQRVSKLSPREIEVIRCYLSGMTITQIAEYMKKGKQTISAQKTNAMKKLGVKNDIELVRCATCLDLIDEESASRFEVQ
ncbi:MULTISPECIES: response regulator transcription factor [Burkholderia]|uniref:response regulator transcription factor n=1 Tax=unclassified Burkholderia TaxID=2613784 RepID=UPI00075E7FE6|nr:MULTISPECIES: response regulator transcription factor [Burkholderia]KUY55229.1 helix-turn-helix transcriptional regulator [Burkholderia sp. RF2-non_BP3]KUY83107.1 helix-turn-helix transcriptional regulator [Burkholderia sp. RF4-BP95]KUY90189.1 helix-turn-helix transcriptional regulator [Burkholderia sp. RF7-non_BP4]KUZ03424.1 helix-turn-helix transcriptional regulator [Burkholderia sp. RF7-non_BP1]CAG9245885.1 Helix-turn-helix transcriptional regulator [Burkholderia diffusa]